jgi:prevent-host-death family protein
MKTISMLEFRQQAESVIKMVQQGQQFVLTYRGAPVARLEPIISASAPSDDPFYKIDALADDTGESLTNEEIDRDLYGS